MGVSVRMAVEIADPLKRLAQVEGGMLDVLFGKPPHGMVRVNARVLVATVFSTSFVDDETDHFVEELPAFAKE